MSSARPGRGASLFGILTSIGGLALLIWVVWRVGAGDVVSGLRQVGWGFAAILALALSRQAARARAWTLLLSGPGDTIPLTHATAATLAGDAAGNVTPLSVFVGEPAKAMYLAGSLNRARGNELGGQFPEMTSELFSRFDFTHALAALAAENFFYSLSVAAMIVMGMIALLAAFPLEPVLRGVSIASLIGMLAVIGAALWIVWRKPAAVSAVLSLLPMRARFVHLIDRVRQFETKTYAFVHDSRGRLGGVVLCDVLFHIASVAETFVTIWLLTGSTSVLAAFIFDSFQRVVNVAFRIVPLRVGVDEAGTALVSSALGLGPAAGVTLALVRKARVLSWTAVGLVLLVRRGLGQGIGKLSN
jgi:hypothetical protein